MRVYPRVCGGTCFLIPLPLTNGGLSPRVRGNRRWHDYESDVRGSIPACAGEPVRAENPAGVSAVYPRVCGGTRTRLPRVSESHGLSPRVRGNQDRNNPVRQNERSIPACAGEPAISSIEKNPGEVYPRVCGGT